MCSGERFSLRWDRYQLHLVTAFESLLQESDFVDVTLGVEGKKLSAHKMLLSACSPYFRDLLKGNPCQHPIILLWGIPYNDLSALLQFMYNGEVSVNQDQLDSFLKSAEALKIQGLTNNTEEKSSPSPNQNQSQLKNEDSLNRRKRRASNQQSHCINEQKDNSIAGAKQPKRIEPEVVDVIEDIEDEPKPLTKTIQELVDVDNYDDNVERDDTGGYGDNVEGEEDTGVYADTVYNQESFTQDQQGWTDWGPLQQTEHETDSALEDQQNIPQCHICKKTFLSSASLRNHIPSHQGKTTCQFCGKVESTRSNLYRHLSVMHNVVR